MRNARSRRARSEVVRSSSGVVCTPGPDRSAGGVELSQAVRSADGSNDVVIVDQVPEAELQRLPDAVPAPA